jgi:hypothetical protein
MDGGTGDAAAVAGGANTGGGGGGGIDGYASSSGGTGVVILRVLTADYTGTLTGSPTVTSSGSYTFIKFTANGTYTQEGTGRGLVLPSQATQAAIEAETNEYTYAPPDIIKYSPGVAKGYVAIAANGASHDSDYNVDTVTDVAAGNRTIVWDVDFSGTNYIGVSTVDSGTDNMISNNVLAAGSLGHHVRHKTTGDVDVASFTVAFGEQVDG